jgi:ribokinase
MKLPLLVLGDFAWDVLIRTNTELLRGGDTYGEVMLTPGGSAANVAVWAQRAGLPTWFAGKIGRDRFGQLAQEDLAAEGVQAYFISTDAQLTGSVAVFVDQTGERSMVSGRGADHYLLPSELPKKLLQDCGHLHLTAWSFFTDPPRTAARQAARVAREAGATISLDPGSFQLIGEMGVDTFLGYTQDLGMSVFMPNFEEGSVLTGEKEPRMIVERLAELYPACLIILTLDAEGALVFEDGVATHVPPAEGQLTDATGAGDSFAGAFLARWLTGTGTLKATEFAILVSAWVIERLGARPQPDERLQKILRQPSRSYDPK